MRHVRPDICSHPVPVDMPLSLLKGSIVWMLSQHLRWLCGHYHDAVGLSSLHKFNPYPAFLRRLLLHTLRCTQRQLHQLALPDFILDLDLLFFLGLTQPDI